MPIFDIIRSDHYRSEAEIQVEGHDSLVSYSAKGDTGLTIACVRCALKPGSWGLLSRPRAMLDGFRW